MPRGGYCKQVRPTVGLHARMRVELPGAAALRALRAALLQQDPLTCRPQRRMPRGKTIQMEAADQASGTLQAPALPLPFSVSVGGPRACVGSFLARVPSAPTRHPAHPRLRRQILFPQPRLTRRSAVLRSRSVSLLRICALQTGSEGRRHRCPEKRPRFGRQKLAGPGAIRRGEGVAITTDINTLEHGHRNRQFERADQRADAGEAVASSILLPTRSLSQEPTSRAGVSKSNVSEMNRAGNRSCHHAPVGQ